MIVRSQVQILASIGTFASSQIHISGDTPSGRNEPRTPTSNVRSIPGQPRVIQSMILRVGDAMIVDVGFRCLRVASNDRSEHLP